MGAPDTKAVLVARGDADTLVEMLALPEKCGEPEGERLGTGLAEALGVGAPGVALSEAVDEVDGEARALPEKDGLRERLNVGKGDAEPVGERLPRATEALPAEEADAQGEGDRERAGEGEAEGEWVSDSDGEALRVAPPSPPREAEGPSERDGEPLAEAQGEALGEPAAAEGVGGAPTGTPPRKALTLPRLIGGGPSPKSLRPLPERPWPRESDAPSVAGQRLLHPRGSRSDVEEDAASAARWPPWGQP